MERIRIFGWSRLLTAGLFACMSFVSGCSRDDSGSADDRSEANASMTVTLRGETAGSRAVAPTTDPELTALEEAENALKNVTVFVFNNNGTLDKKHQFSTTGLTETITGLLAGPKKVVVLANVPSGVVFPDGIGYDWFADAANVIELGTQEVATNGLFMSGEGTVTLVADQTAAATVSISRLVAKVKLGTVKIEPDAGHDASKFVLDKVMIMKARGSATMGIPTVAYTPDLFYGGMAGAKSTAKDYLTEDIAADDYANRYFYVLPSDDDDKNTTLLTLAGTYDGEPVYYPFRINDKIGTDGQTSDGTYIKRNTGYVINVTLKKLGSGSSDPEVPADPASLTVTVEPQAWETDLIQNVEW